MNLHRPAYLAAITSSMHPSANSPHLYHSTNSPLSPVSLHKAYTWTQAENLVPGDVFLNDDGTFDGEVYNVTDDGDGIWLEDTHSEGYVDYGKWFRVER